MIFVAGMELYKYTLKHRIGGGNFGEVWLAHDEAVNADIAVKLLGDHLASATANLKEAQMGNCLTHANVVKIHYADVVHVAGTNIVVIAMDYQANGSIVKLVNSGNFIVAPRAISLTIDVLRGLEYLHEQSIFHNDIKPSNILLGTKNEALLTDYGISCSSPGLLPTAAPNAYVLHRAPETTASNSISVTTDIYQVGLTLFRLLNGLGTIDNLLSKVGFTEFEKLKTQGKVPPIGDFLPFVEPTLMQIIRTATDQDPTRRFQSALEMRRAMEKIPKFGHWDMDSTGALFGTLGRNRYTYSITKSKAGYVFTAQRENLDTGRQTKISKFTARLALESECNKLKKQLMLAVVKGEL